MTKLQQKNAPVPEPEELRQDIEALEEWVKNINRRNQ